MKTKTTPALQDLARKTIRGSLGFDLGTGNLKTAFVSRDGTTEIFPTMPAHVAFEKKTGKATAFGAKAKEQFERVNGNTAVCKPFRSGMIKDLYVTSLIADHAANMVTGKRNLLGSTFDHIVLSVPHSEVNEAFRNHCEKMAHLAFSSMGAGEVSIVPQLILAAIGAGIPVTEPKGVGMMDIGAGTGQFGIISDGKVKFGKCTDAGGDLIDHGIQAYLRMHHQLDISLARAEAIKVIISENLTHTEIEIDGAAVGSTGPKRVAVPISKLEGVIHHNTYCLAGALFETTVNIPSAFVELRNDVAENGVILTGGGAMLRGLASSLRDLHISVKVADAPQLCVIIGITKTLQDRRLLEKVRTHHYKRPMWVSRVKYDPTKN